MPAFTLGTWKICNTNKHLVYSSLNDKAVALAIGPIDNEQKANAQLISTAPEMYRALKKCAEFVKDVICRNCEDCSLALDAEGLREYLEGIFARIEGTKEEE